MSKAIPEISTEITTKNSSETSSSSKLANAKEEKSLLFLNLSGNGKIGNNSAENEKTWWVKFSSKLVQKAIKLGVENNLHRCNYKAVALRNLKIRCYKTLDKTLDIRLAHKSQKHQQTIIKTNPVSLHSGLAP
ncbi:hypothetical protein [Bacillus sp. 1P02SD]|uniref:hypothetical protein n=1 Tax=Bacillus sp. 1P02SD TaxID=3132264 RepID=UPI0039A2699C